MRFWLITVGEPLPTDGPSERLLRTGVLAKLLLDRGHDVVWWSSTMDHIRKVQRFDTDVCLKPWSRLELRLLHSTTYRKNLSFARIANHYGIARKFRRQAADLPQPDAILCSYPTLELSLEAVCYGRRRGVPVALDARDKWPDILTDVAPVWARPAARLALSPMFRTARRAFSGATSVVGITPAFVDWGLSYAGRPRTQLDRDFPLAYSGKDPSPEAIDAAMKFWRELGLKGDGELVACFFGTIRPQMELDTVIEAARLLEGQRPRIRFVICGHGERLDHVQKLAASSADFLFPGWVDSDKIWALMRLSSVGLAPYKTTADFAASIPNKPIEYFAGGLPVVSSLGGLLAETLAKHECGVTYRNGRADELAKALADLRDHPDRLRAMARNATALYEQRFVGETIYAGMADYLESLASSGAGRGAATTASAQR